MKIIKYFGSFLILLILNCEAMRSNTSLFSDYLATIQKMRSMHKNQLEALTESRLYRHMNFATESRTEYVRRKSYSDVLPYTNKSGTFTGEEAIIEEWKDNCPGLLWRQGDCELHHIIPRGYGGQNVWWNIFPLTFKNHRKKGEGIHSSDEYKVLFPKVTGKEE